jgi:hypothetical protein
MTDNWPARQHVRETTGQPSSTMEGQVASQAVGQTDGHPDSMPRHKNGQPGDTTDGRGRRMVRESDLTPESDLTVSTWLRKTSSTVSCGWPSALSCGRAVHGGQCHTLHAHYIAWQEALRHLHGPQRAAEPWANGCHGLVSYLKFAFLPPP